MKKTITNDNFDEATWYRAPTRYNNYGIVFDWNKKRGTVQLGCSGNASAQDFVDTYDRVKAGKLVNAFGYNIVYDDGMIFASDNPAHRNRYDVIDWGYILCDRLMGHLARRLKLSIKHKANWDELRNTP